MFVLRNGQVNLQAPQKEQSREEPADGTPGKAWSRQPGEQILARDHFREQEQEERDEDRRRRERRAS